MSLPDISERHAVCTTCGHTAPMSSVQPPYPGPRAPALPVGWRYVLGEPYCSAVECEADATREQRDDKLIEADALFGGEISQAGVKGGRHA